MEKCVKTNARKRPHLKRLTLKTLSVIVTTSRSDGSWRLSRQQRIICVKGNFHPERGGERSFLSPSFRPKAWKTKCPLRPFAEHKPRLPARTAVSRAGKLDTLQTPPWHPTPHLLMNWIIKQKASRANYIHCGNYRGGTPRSLPGNAVRMFDLTLATPMRMTTHPK